MFRILIVISSLFIFCNVFASNNIPQLTSTEQKEVSSLNNITIGEKTLLGFKYGGVNVGEYLTSALKYHKTIEYNNQLNNTINAVIPKVNALEGTYDITTFEQRQSSINQKINKLNNNTNNVGILLSASKHSATALLDAIPHAITISTAILPNAKEAINVIDEAVSNIQNIKLDANINIGDINNLAETTELLHALFIETKDIIGGKQVSFETVHILLGTLEKMGQNIDNLKSVSSFIENVNNAIQTYENIQHINTLSPAIQSQSTFIKSSLKNDLYIQIIGITGQVSQIFADKLPKLGNVVVTLEELTTSYYESQTRANTNILHDNLKTINNATTLLNEIINERTRLLEDMNKFLINTNLQQPTPKDSNNTGTTSDTLQNNGTLQQTINTNNLTQAGSNKFSLSGNMSLITNLGNFVYGSATSASAFDKTSVKTFSDITKNGNDVLIKIYNNNQYLTTILANPINNNNLSSYAENTNSNTIKATLETKGADNYNYSYLAWGEWNGKANLAFTNPSNGQQSNITHGQYIVGIPAENNLPKSGTAHYTGNIQGDFTPNNSFATEKNTIGGTVSMDANFNGNPTISGDINATHNGNQFGHGHFDNLAIDRQSATFHGNFNNNVNGGIGGTFYGNGDEMGGGGFMYNNLGNASYVFEAHKQ